MLKVLIQVVMFALFLAGWFILFQKLGARAVRKKPQTPEQKEANRLALHDTVYIATGYCVMVAPRVHPPDGLFGIHFSIVYAVAFGACYAVAYAWRIKHSPAVN